jgi:hypothetical protein
MKKLIQKMNSGGGLLAAALAAIVAVMWFVVIPLAQAQISAMGGGANIQGTTNGPVVATITETITVRPLSITVTGGTNAASIFIGNVYASINGSTNGAILVGTLTNAVGTGTFTTNVAAFQGSVPVTLYLQAVTGTNTLNVNGIYGP